MTDDLSNEVLEALNALGATSEEVAASLRAEGVKGWPGEPCHCPIARLIARRWPSTTPGVAARDFRLTEYPESEDLSEWPVFYELPEPVARFVSGFDVGLWPDLREGSTA